MNTAANKIVLRRDRDFCSLYYIRSGLRVLDLPAGWRVESEIGKLPEGYWVDTHTVFNEHGEQVCCGESLSDDVPSDTLSELRRALAYYVARWNGHSLSFYGPSEII